MLIRWTDYGKVKEIDTLYQGNLSPNIQNSTPSAILPKLRFKYDATGNRLEKEYVLHYKDIYLRDPQGNVMAVYRIAKDSLFLTELPMYGEKRLGVIKENKFLMKKPTQNSIVTPVIVTASKPPAKTSIYPLGKKHYETTDRLGNVRVTYTEKKSWNNGKFALNVSSSQDYYPFGSVMEGRGAKIEIYRWGVQGWERDNEILGLGNLYATFYRMHDSRIGRTWSVDPKRQFPSSYIMLGNNPLNGIDKDGAWFWEKANIRQARAFAKQTGGKFSKWKGQDKKAYASVTFFTSNYGTGSVNNAGAEVTLDEIKVTSYIFRPGQDYSDLLIKSGIGFYRAKRISATGWNRITWLFRSGDAWNHGWGEYNRKGQAPGIIKGIAGLNPLVSSTNAVNVLITNEDIYGLEANSKTDKVLAIAALLSPFNPATNISNSILRNSKAGEVIDNTNTIIQFANDAGLLDNFKTQNLKNNKNDENP